MCEAGAGLSTEQGDEGIFFRLFNPVCPPTPNSQLVPGRNQEMQTFTLLTLTVCSLSSGAAWMRLFFQPGVKEV